MCIRDRSSTDIVVSDLNKDHGLFISFAPSQNPHLAPQIAVAVFVENGEHGSSVAGPIAKAVTDKYLLDILQIDFNSLNDSPAPAQPVKRPLITSSDE